MHDIVFMTWHMLICHPLSNQFLTVNTKRHPGVTLFQDSKLGAHLWTVKNVLTSISIYI